MREKICGIYKISFLSTSKVYIGQSTDIYRRLWEHWASANAFEDNLNEKTKRDYQLPIHRAMRKYGHGSTCLEILERCPKESLNEREKYWIDFYQSADKKYGYNLSYGGQDSFGLKGERHSRAILTQRQVDEIKDLLQHGTITMKEIAAQYHVSKVTITNINRGKTWHVEGKQYPIRSDADNLNIATEAIRKKTIKATREEVIAIRQKYATMCSLQEIYDAYSQYSAHYINRIIYNSQVYPDIPLFNRKTRQWEYKNTK